jgi:uncharacterized membrane protein
VDLLILLALLVGPYVAVRLFSLKADRSDAGALGATLLFLMTGVGHFVLTKKMVEMLPEWIPQRTLIVQVTGALELALAAALAIRRTRVPAGWTALALLVAFFPANIYASLTYAPMGGGSMGPLYLLIRGPLQIAFMYWIYQFCIRPSQRLNPTLT